MKSAAPGRRDPKLRASRLTVRAPGLAAVAAVAAAEAGGGEATFFWSARGGRGAGVSRGGAAPSEAPQKAAPRPGAQPRASAGAATLTLGLRLLTARGGEAAARTTGAGVTSFTGGATALPAGALVARLRVAILELAAAGEAGSVDRRRQFEKGAHRAA